MRRDCAARARAALPRQQESARFRHPPWLLPTERGARPFRIWCLDLITGLQPAAPDGSTEVIVGIDPFTRWLEMAALPDKSAARVVTWFHEQIVCRYGTPTAVRTDNGTEFLGDFDAYLRSWGIQHQLCSVRNPRANGLVERLNGTIKRGLRRFLTAMPHSYCWEYLQEVARACRMSCHPALGGVSPFFAVYKMDPTLPLPAYLRSWSDDEVVNFTAEAI